MQQNHNAMKNDLFTEQLKQSTGFRLFIYLMLLLICSLLGSAISLFMAIGNDINLLRAAQAISHVMMFTIPPIVLYLITREKPMQEIGFRRISPIWAFFAGLALMFISLPITNLLTAWNESMNFGEAFAKIEELLKSMEEAAAALTERMLDVDTIGGLLVNLLVIALIPAIGEELTFRGVLQQALTKGCKNPHVAIILTAAIFSFIHLQFYGFFPRMFLGLILGYMFYATGSLWTSITMHFLNNGTAVVVYYLDNKGIIDADVDSFGATSNVLLVVLSLVATVAIIVLALRKKKETK